MKSRSESRDASRGNRVEENSRGDRVRDADGARRLESNEEVGRQPRQWR